MHSDMSNETQTEALAVPLLPPQIEAAERLHGRLKGYTTAERVLDGLRKVPPDFTPEAILLKAAAVDKLYFANVFAIYQMADHIGIEWPRLPEDPVAAVKTIAKIPCIERNFWGFASKFAHFFIDPERFPIYDRFCRRQTAYHLGRPQRDSYPPFFQDICDLRKLSGVSCSLCQLDHYLWLAGIYREWCRTDGEMDIGAEVRALLENPPCEVKRDLKALCPDIGGDVG